MTTPWIEVFRTGTHTDASGKKKKYTLSHLHRIVAKFNTKSLDVPAVVGHPRTNDPAYGWVSAIRIVGSRLFAKFTQVDKKFWAAVKAGRFKKRSIALNADGALAHVGWLGGVPPAVEGMKDAFRGSKKSRIYTFRGGYMKTKKKKKKGTMPFDEYMGMEEDMSKEKKRRKKAEKRMKRALKKSAKSKKEAAEYATFMSPKASRKRQKARKKRVDALIEKRKITPADRGGVVAYATALSRDTKKISLVKGKKKRTLEDHFLRGLEKGEDSPIYQEFSVDNSGRFVGLGDEVTGDTDGFGLDDSEEIKEALELVGMDGNDEPEED
ncbi:MAG: hypothetical protein OXI23_18625 [Gemmatimonadota bacterium]|nr:hypothetical protein [Gemmatimonadota bacterium]